jgi:hypothetical protein
MRLLAVVVALAALTPVARAGGIDPAKLVLRQSDVPTAYHVNRDKSGVRTLARDTREFPELRVKYRSWGHLVGYQVQFDHVNDTISSRVDLLRSRLGAQGMFAWFVQEANRQSQLHLRPSRLRLGDEGKIYWWKFQAEEFTIVLWRSGRTFSVVGGGGITKRKVIALARTQQQRVAAALG